MRVTAAVKACTKCGETKPLTEFYINKSRASAKCKPCHLAHYSPAYIARWREKRQGASWGASCPVCGQRPEVRSTVAESASSGWLVYCCALYWTVTDQQLMDSL